MKHLLALALLTSCYLHAAEVTSMHCTGVKGSGADYEVIITLVKEENKAVFQYQDGHGDYELFEEDYFYRIRDSSAKHTLKADINRLTQEFTLKIEGDQGKSEIHGKCTKDELKTVL
jgi:hypothetical protein